MTPDEKEFVQQLLDIRQPMQGDLGRSSVIILLLRATRKLCCRNPETGVYEEERMNTMNMETIPDYTSYGFQFSGLLNYLIFLESIGLAFEPKRPKRESQDSNGIVRSLTFYSTLLGHNQMNALKTLRHSLAKLWTGDKKLKNGLEKQGFKRAITTDEIFKINFEDK